MDISKIKNATIGLGLIDTNSTICAVGGSGVIIDPRGYFITATHVLTGLEKLRNELLENNKESLETWLAMISYIPHENGKYSLITNRITNYFPFGLDLENLDFDISLGWLSVKEENHPFLEISDRRSFLPLEQVTMCGYPGGNFTLNPYGSIVDLSFSPVIENTTIGSLMPADDAPTHQGMIMNNISTGGSSGSPVIDSSEKIIGIAQWVIPAEVNVNISDTFATAKIGKTFALSCAVFSDCNKAISQIESGAKTITGLEMNRSKSIFIKNIPS